MVGAGGLLGTALTTNLRERRDEIVLSSQVSWTTRKAQADLTEGLDRLGDVVRSHRVPWRIAWCAGAGVTGTTEEVLSQEVLDPHGIPGPGCGQLRAWRQGSVFLASSAGGLYAGSGQGGPYDEMAVPQPISPYGRAKVAAERVVAEFAERTGNTALIGRIANLYGPGQNLSKNQGLISHLCRANLTRQPLSVYVSMDTIRDYLYVDDCAGLVADMLDRADAARRGQFPALDPTTVKVLASGHGTTIGSLIALCRQVFKRAPHVVLGDSPNARFQVKDLRLRSTVWRDLDRRSLMPLPGRDRATAAGIRRATQSAGL